MVSYADIARRLDALRSDLSLEEGGALSEAGASRLDRTASFLYTCGQFADVLRTGDRLSACYRNASDTVGLVRSEVRSGFSRIHVGRPQEAQSAARLLLEEIDRNHPKRILVEILSAYASLKMGRFDDAFHICSESEKTAVDDRARSSLSFIRAWALLGQGDLRQAETESGIAVSCAERSGWDYGAINAWNCRGAVFKNMGMPGRAAAALRAALRLLSRLSYPYLHAHSLLSLANLNLRMGRPRRALRRVEEAGKLTELFSWEMLEPTVLVCRARILRLLHRDHEAHAGAAKARDRAAAHSHRRTLALAHEELGELALLRDDLAAAERSFTAGLRIAEAIAPRGDIFAELARRLADVRIEQGRWNEAKPLVARALDVSRSCSDRREEGTCHRTQARIARAEGHSPRAWERYNRAVALFRLITDRIELARTLEERGRFAPESARDLDEAAALYRRAGMDADAARICGDLFLPAAAAPGEDPFAAIVTGSPSMEVPIATARRVAGASCPVLLMGETGTGKELFARAIHEAGRPGRPFVALNCAGLAEGLLDSELFGHRAGAFTGAREAKEGLVESASGGTLLLDEIDKATHRFQGRLLRFLDSGEYRRLGETGTRRARVRVIAASNRDLRLLAERDGFLLALFYRLRGIELRLPPLREREGDIALLAGHFLRRAARRSGQSVRLAPGSLALLARYRWPGNVRELKSEIERAALLARSGIVAPHHLSRSLRPGRPRSFAGLLPLEKERALLLETRERCGGKVRAMAEQLGWSRSTVYRKLDLHGLKIRPPV